MEGAFAVLTNGEHEGRRGVNRLVESALGDVSLPGRDGLYLPGLAAGGVQFQDRFGNLNHPGVVLRKWLSWPHPAGWSSCCLNSCRLFCRS